MDYTDISILHTNDMHSYMENFPKKAQLIADIQDGNEKRDSELQIGLHPQMWGIVPDGEGLWSMAEQSSQIRSIRL